ncbi:MAG: DUF1318 domain-containing protein [Candidatus Omnitrophica bacterium]|nr:DUF1318 domain-containing protein [Candidatus Omnitrophota bacterium]
MGRIIFIIFVILVLSIGCARIKVEAPKEPIKVDITMRLDIYQHIQKDIDAIESIVKENKSQQQQSFLGYLIPTIYAQEELSPQVQEAAIRRRDRTDALRQVQKQGIVGENKEGLVEIRKSSASDIQLEELIRKENEDRMIIYQALAQKNSVAVEDIQRIYALRLQNDAPSGTPIEILEPSTGKYIWKVK